MTNFKRYTVSTDFVRRNPTTRIMLPDNKRPFKIHPSDMLENVWLLYEQEQKKWFLINPILAENCEVEGVVIGDLYHAVYSDGEYFILPVTKSSEGLGNTYSESLEEIIEQARGEWMLRGKADKDKMIHRAITAKDISKKVKWQMDFYDCLEDAFQGRVIDKVADLKNNSSRVVSIEEEF